MTEPLPDSAARLLASRRRIRSLARELVFDAPEVDDVAQEAWIATHASPHRQEPGYLRRMLRGLASNRERARHRRRHREERAAAEEATASAEDLVTEAETQRRVLDAVLGLAEPYRSCVLLRYWGDHPPRVIADRLGVPVETVRTRLKRAIAELRNRLDRDFGDRSQWRSALIPLAIPGGMRWGSGLGFGGLFVSTTSKILLSLAGIAGALLLILAGLGILPFGGEVHQDRTAAITRTDDKAHSDAPSPPSSPQQASAQEPTRATTTSLIDPEIGILLYGVVRYEEGTPAESCRIWLEKEDGSIQTTQFGRNGAYSALGLTPGSWTLHADQEGYQPVETSIELDREAQVRQDLVLRPSLRVRVAVVTPDGTSFDPEKAGAPEHAVARDFGITAVATPFDPGDILPGITRGTAARYGIGSFTPRTPREPLPELDERYCGYLEIRAPLPVYVSAVVGGAVLETVRLDRAVDEVELVVPPDAYHATLGGLRLRLIDRDTRQPLTGVRIGHGHAGRASSGPATDDNGVWELAPIPPNIIHVDIYSHEHEWMSRNFKIRPGETREETIELSPRRRISGHILNADGSATSHPFTVLAPSHVRIPFDADPRMNRNSDVNGHFEVDSAGRSPIVLLVSDGKARHPLYVEAGSEDQDNLEFRLKRAVPVIVIADPPLPQGFGITIADELGMPFDLPYGRNIARLELPPGRYEAWCFEDEIVHHRVPFNVEADAEACRVELPGVVR